MDKSHLGRLPAELRNEIYELTFANCDPFHTRFRKYHPRSSGFSPSSTPQRDSHPIALLATCKQAMVEARGIAFKNTGFVVHASVATAASAFRAMVRDLGAEVVKGIPRVRLDIGEVNTLASDKGIHNRLETALVEIWYATRLVGPSELEVCIQVLIGHSRFPCHLMLQMKDIEALRASVKACEIELGSVRGLSRGMQIRSYVDCFRIVAVLEMVVFRAAGRLGEKKDLVDQVLMGL